MSGIQMAYDFLLPEDAQSVVDKTINAEGWMFGQLSSFEGMDEQQFPFWMLKLDHDAFFTAHIFHKIQETFQTKFLLDRVYANGQTYGLPGSTHQDGNSAMSYTLLYYVNQDWRPLWGGETIIHVPDQGPIAVMPQYNTAVLFPGNWWHFGKEPSRHFTGLRVTLAFKLKYAGQYV